MKNVLTLIAALCSFYFTSAQVVPPTSNDPAGKVLLATDTVALKTTRNMEKGNSETVKTKDHPKVTRKTKTVNKDSTSVQKRK